MYIPCADLMRSDFTKKRYSDVLTSNIQSESHMVQPPYVISYYLILGFRGGILKTAWDTPAYFYSA